MSNHLLINVVYEHLKEEQAHSVHCGEVSVIWSPLPIKGADIYAYLNAHSFRGPQGGISVLLMMEPLVVLPGVYSETVLSRFDHVFTWCDALTKQGGRFKKIFLARSGWIIDSPITEDLQKREQRYPVANRKKAICMINGNKQSFIAGELYSKRLEAALWFHYNSDLPFDVFGTPPFPLPNYKGALAPDAKLSTLADYQYCLCFENTNYPTFSSGLVTEKILDCLEARTIPIYYGCANIDEYVPRECFIDFREFRSYGQLNAFLHNMAPERYAHTIDCIDKWVSKGGLRPYSWFTIYDQLAALAPGFDVAKADPAASGPSSWQPGVSPSCKGREWVHASSGPIWSWQSLAAGTSPLLEETGVAGASCLRIDGSGRAAESPDSRQEAGRTLKGLLERFPEDRELASIVQQSLNSINAAVAKTQPVAKKGPFMPDTNTDLKQRSAEYYRRVIAHYQADSFQTDKFVHPVWKQQLATLGALIMNDLPDNFLLHPICLEMFVRAGWRPQQEQEMAYLEKLDKNLRDKLFSVQESPIGSIPRDCKNHPISVNTLGMLWYLARIHEELTKSLALIVEFGGGFGSLARVFKTLGKPDLTYAIIDLPEMLALQHYYLSGTLGQGAVAAHLSPEEPVVPGKINLYPVYGIEALDIHADLFVSTFALSETPAFMQDLVCSTKNFFNASFLYITGQYVTERKELGWQPPHTIIQSAWNSRTTVKTGRFHIGDNYELLASGLKKPVDQQLLSAAAAIASASHPTDARVTPSVHSSKEIVGLIFSKDRAMQLDCTLRSLFLHCTDADQIALRVLYTTSSQLHEGQYEKLKREYPQVEFIREASFKNDLLSALSPFKYVLFLVDDNVFVRDFLITQAVEQFSQLPDALGFSLRLGENTTYCYMLNQPQALPKFSTAGNSVLSYDWSTAPLDFGYPLEVSSSLYRIGDLLQLLNQIDFKNPNTLELLLESNKTLYTSTRSRLLCFDRSVAFCNPLNMVQTMWVNRAGNKNVYTPDKLSQMFEEGLRIDVIALSGFTPNACHQEIEFSFVRQPEDGSGNTAQAPLVSIMIISYNGIDHIKACLESIERNTPESHEIVIVDNARNDGSLEYVKTVPNTIVIANPGNIGYSPARAQAMSIVRGKYIISLDDDTIVTKGWVGKFIKHAQEHPEVGIFGPRSNYVSGPQIVPNVAYKDIGELETFAETWSTQHLDRVTPAYRLVGFCMFVVRKVIDRIGCIDPNFGKLFGFDDDDYSFRAQIAGFKLAIADDIFIHHTGGPQGKGDKQYNELMLGAWEMFKEKWGIQKDTPYGTPYNLSELLSRPFDKKRYYSPLYVRSLLDKYICKSPTASQANDVLSPADDGHKRAEFSAASGTFKEAAFEPSKLRTAETRKGSVSIIIPVRNKDNHLDKCVSSLKKYTPEPHELIIVGDGDAVNAKWLKNSIKKTPSVTLVERKPGAGFAECVNAGIRTSSGEYLLILDSDTAVTDGWLAGMLECLNRSSDPGIVGPMTDRAGGRQCVTLAHRQSSSRFCDIAKSFRERNRHRRVAVNTIDQFCMLFRHELVEKVGILDEGLDTDDSVVADFCLRCAMAGHHNLIAGDAMIHCSSADAGRGSTKAFRNKWRMANTNSRLGENCASMKAIQKAGELFNRGQLDGAIAALMEAITQTPDEKAIYLYLADIMIDSKRFQDALDAINSLPETAKSDVKTLELIGYCKEGLELFDEAQAYADRVLELASRSPAAVNLKGILSYRKGDRAAAETFFARAIEADPGCGEPYTNLGMLKWSSDKKEEALDLFEKGFILSPTAEDIVAAYHTACNTTGAFSRAEQVFQDAKALYPQNRRIAFLLIDLLIKQDKYDLAMHEIEQAMILVGIDDGMLAAALAVRDKIGPSTRKEARKNERTLSLAMIVKNEEQYLAQCLMSVKPIADEIIVVDTGSTDRTKSIAKALGAKVFDYEWTNDFAEARNVSLAKASGDWIFVMDADEIISPLDYPFFARVLKNTAPQSIAYSFNTRNYTDVVGLESWSPNDDKYYQESAGCGWVPSRKVRLFRNHPSNRFVNPVHEVVEPSLLKRGIELKPCDVPIHHYGRLNTKKLSEKHEKYYALGIKKLKEKGKSIRALQELAIQAGELQKHEEAIELWNSIIEMDPNHSLAYYNKGGAFLVLRRYKEALAATKKAVELEPLRKEAVTNYALSEILVGEMNNAVVILQDLVSRNPGYPIALGLLGATRFIAGDKQSGKSLFTKLRNLNFNFVPFIRDTAARLIECDRTPIAEKLIDAAIECGFGNYEIVALKKECLKQTAARSA